MPQPEAELRRLIQNHFSLESRSSDIPSLASELKREALRHYDDHLGQVLGFYAENIGLATSQRGRARRYAASDAFLESLVLANVKEPIELEEFLRLLHDRYGLVIGPEVGREVYGNVNHSHLRTNQRQFEERLRLLGLLKRLSDDCAFAQNPFWKLGGS